MKLLRNFMIIMSAFCLLLPSTSLATDTKALEQQVQELARQHKELQAQLSDQRREIESNVQRLSEHKRDLSRNREHLQQQEEKLAETLSEQTEITNCAERLKSINEHVKIGGLLEVEAGFNKDYNDNDASDITLATAAMHIDVDLHKYVAAHLLFLWEEEDTEPVDLDEGYVVLGNTEYFPLFLQAGKLYVPFGNFESHMISDPLTLELGETRETAAVLGVEYKGFHLSTYAFNGDINEFW